MKIIKMFTCEWEILVKLILETVWVSTTKDYKIFMKSYFIFNHISAFLLKKKIVQFLH